MAPCYPRSRPAAFGCRSVRFALLLTALLVPRGEGSALRGETAARSIDFNRDIRPILSDRCFFCHGPDDQERKGDLRLDHREQALAPLPSGNTAIVPGQHNASELVRRILSTDPDEVMPPPAIKKPLSDADKQKLLDWIDQGAEYRQHWSFVVPTRPDVPNDPFQNWARNPIDHFIAQRLHAEGLQPTPEASRETLIRRVTLDLTGLPPTIAEIDAFLADTDPHAYEHLVDRLLASPHYGERMTLDWLDAARFADTNGYHLDNGRDMTRWRAWVIDAYNRNLPFDDFTIQQLAGDLLPFATMDQKIASGFHRNHMINFEGGAIPEEYLNAYIVDRVNTTAAVWLGLTVACAQCHDHKYDPISQREFYQLYAFFNNVPEKGLDGNRGNAAPLLAVPTEDQATQIKHLHHQVTQLEQAQQQREARHREPQAAWEQTMTTALASAAPPALPAEIRDILVKSAQDRNDQDRQKIADHFRREVLKDAEWIDGFRQLEELRKQRSALEGAIPTTMVMQEMPMPRDTFLLVRGKYDQPSDKVVAGVPASLHRLPSHAPNNRLGLAQWLVSADNPLTSRVIVNRYWQMFFGIGLVKTAEDFGSQGEPPSHPELLDWLAREFQSASTPPVLGTGTEAWNIKGLIRLMVTSSTYRQSSRVDSHLLAVDPENRLHARGARFRLPAEFVRDQALALSGLLKHKIGGPSVSPYQPGELWGELSSRNDSANWTAQFFQLSSGDDLYRRSMYTFWKRTCPPPQMSTFDAPDRETCVVRRARTNTPLQALILMNDPTYIEASRKLAERILTEASNDQKERFLFAFRTVTGRSPTDAELQALEGVLTPHLEYFAQHPAAAAELLTNGASPSLASAPPTELAAWSMLSSVLLNLDEVICRN